MTSTEIRNSFLKFFEERGHTIVPSASVIPYDDPTLLFTNAGMNQFKDVFLGTGKRDYVRAANSQKCIRVSGKHNDLEEVGRDTYHHTFFEMLGNWSFGDYYKKEAIEWAWELLTKVWGGVLDKKRLYATVFETDDEAYEHWKKVTDIGEKHILRFGKKDNFWEMGETGPCGPCSEIHIDLTEDLSGGKLVNAGDPRVMEIWNLVFIQYDRDQKENLTPLLDESSHRPAKHVDTGMGFERMCAVLQGKKSNYDTDVFTTIIQRIAEITKKSYVSSLISDFEMPIADSQRKSKINKSQSEIDIAMRVIADHVRMLAFSIADGGIPSNEGRGYVMRRILRRAARFGRNLDMHQPFIYQVVDAVVKSMREQFPEIKDKQNHIERVIKGEEESFNATLDRGLEIFESVMGRIGDSKAFPGEEAFKLYDTYGFPIDLTQLMAGEHGLHVDMERFNVLMGEQRARSKGAEISSKEKREDRWGNLMPDISPLEKIQPKFVGYEYLEVETEVGVSGLDYVVLKLNPFYAESGGQVSDTGIIQTVDGRIIKVEHAEKYDKYSWPQVSKSHGLKFKEVVFAKVEKQRRRNIERNHTATHIVHEALRRVLGEHLHQQGSLVAPDHLRFDFNHFEKISPDQLKKIEDMVNEKIIQDILVEAESDPAKWISIEEAKKKYPKVKMFFGDKYGNKVRVVVVDSDFSVELCGGTHVKNTRDIGLFKIISESSVASGIRRIEAVTGDGLNQYIQNQIEKIGDLDRHLEQLLNDKIELERQLGRRSDTPMKTVRAEKLTISSPQMERESIEAIEQLLRERERIIEHETKNLLDLKKENSKVRVRQASSGIDAIVAGGVSLNGFKVVSARIEATTMDELKSLGDTLRSKLSSGVGVLGAIVDEKVALVCVVTDDLIKDKKLQAGKIVGEIAKRVGGGGGGRPHLATAGGKDISKLDEALHQTAEIVRSMLKSNN